MDLFMQMNGLQQLAIMTFLNDYLLALTNLEDIRGVKMLPLYEAFNFITCSNG